MNDYSLKKYVCMIKATKIKSGKNKFRFKSTSNLFTNANFLLLTKILQLILS